ncbi:MAG: hypothetical protein ACTSVV_14955 [Promethearchaeota archaeon]
MKIKYVLILILIFFSFISIPQISKAYEIIYFNIDKQTYYINENIKINSSWTLYYNENTSQAYFQVVILNNQNELIWSSPSYSEQGLIIKNWTVKLDELNINFNGTHSLLFINLLYHYSDLSGTFDTYVRSISINIIKLNITCELVGFKNIINYGDLLRFQAIFHNILHDSLLYKFNVSLQIFFNHKLIYNTNFSLLENGSIKIILNSAKDLRIGTNLLKFSILENKYYNNQIFYYNLKVNKLKVYIDKKITPELLNENSILKIYSSFYYFLNGNILPLKEYFIKLKILEKDRMVYERSYLTDNNGIIEITIKIKNLELSDDVKNIAIIFNIIGNNFLNDSEFITSINFNHINVNTFESFFLIIIISVSMFAISIYIAYFGKRKITGLSPSEISIKF